MDRRQRRRRRDQPAVRGRDRGGGGAIALLEIEEKLDLLRLPMKRRNRGNIVDFGIEVVGVGVVIEHAVVLPDGFEEVVQHHQTYAQLQSKPELLLMSRNTLVLHLSNRMLITLHLTHTLDSDAFSSLPFTTQLSLPMISLPRSHHSAYAIASFITLSIARLIRRMPLDSLLMKKSWKWIRNRRSKRKKPGIACQQITSCEVGGKSVPSLGLWRERMKLM